MPPARPAPERREDLRAGPLVVGGVEVPPGTVRRITLALTEVAIRLPLPLPVTVVDGSPPGPPLFQYAGIPEFQAIGTQVGQMIAAALTGQMPVDQALQGAQSAVERTMRQAGYPK